MLRNWIASEYHELILSACLLVASATAVCRRFSVASLVMVASSGFIFIITIGYPLLLLYLPNSVPLETLDRFHFGIVLRGSKILFGLSFVWFMIQQRRASGTQSI